MGAMGSQITCLTIVLLNRLFQAQIKENIKAPHLSTPLAFVRGINRWPVNSPHKGQ